MLITLGEAVAYLLSGNYGDIHKLGIFHCCFIVLQLLFAGLLVELMDEVLQNGYGFGSAISLFISLNICESVLWKSFSPLTFKKGESIEFEGAVIALFHYLIVKPNKVDAIKEAFFREGNGANLQSCLLYTSPSPRDS